MSLGPELVRICLVAEGFPLSLTSAEVVRYFQAAAKANVVRIAPLKKRKDTDTVSGWLLLLSHDDQVRCLLQCRNFVICHEDKNYTIRLNYPEVSFTSQELSWETVMERQEGQPDSVASEDMFGDDGQKTSQTAQGPPESQGPQQTRRQPDPPQQGRHAMEQGVFSPPPYYPPHLYFYNLYGSNPNLSNVGEEPGRQVFPGQWNLEGNIGYQQQQGGFWPVGPAGHGHGPVTPDRNPSQNYTAPGYPDPSHTRMVPPRAPQNRSEPPHRGMEVQQQAFTQVNPPGYGTGSFTPDRRLSQPTPGNPDSSPVMTMSPHLQGERNEPPVTGMEDLSAKQELPQQFLAYRDPSVDFSSGSDFQSDFVVLPETQDEDEGQRLRHFHLKVTDLPPSITESELVQFFEDRRQSGGGPVTKVELNPSAKSAAVFFAEEQAIERVMGRTPLLLKDKIIQVSPAQSESSSTEAEIRTCEIRGLQSEEETEICVYYFENPAKGGGDIESQEWNEEEKVFFITFKDPEVARTVTTKEHKLGGKVLEVSLYSPPAKEPEDSPPQCTVEVRGFDPSQGELYDAYFSNPKKGGDNIVNISFNADNTVMFITFETPEVAQRVAEQTHVVGKRQLEVIVAPVEEPTPPCTVLVRGCSVGKEEVCRYYFDNPRKGGGDIAEFVVDQEQQTILITFEEPEVAQSVIAREHNVAGCNLEVSMYVPKKQPAKPQKPEKPTEEEEEEAAQPLRTVVVSMGQGPLQSEDSYLLYFESPRHEGGEVEHMEFDQEKQLVYITFAEPAVAEHVAGKQHRIMGQAAEVALYVPPKPKPTYPNKLLIQNVADSTTRECLCMYLEKVAGMEPQEVLYGDQVGTVLVTFPEEPDFPQTLKGIQKRTLEKRSLTASRVAISSCLLVENLGDQTTEDTVELYFENTNRSKGGPVERVEMVPGERKCFVYFESHEVLDGVLSKQHRIDGKDLRVKRYMECLGVSGGSNDPTAFTMPKPLVLDRLDPYKVTFLNQSHSIMSGFLQQLSSSYAQGRFEGSSLIVDCTLTPAVPKARILARTWSVSVEESVAKYLALLEVKSCRVVQQLWAEVAEAVRKAEIKGPDGAAMIPVPEDCTFVVVGLKSMAEQLFEQVSSVIRSKEEEIERRKQEVTEPISTLTNSQLRLLLAIGFNMEAGKRHEGLKVDIQVKKKCIIFHGMLRGVKEAQVEMYQLLQSMKEQKITTMTDLQKKVLDGKETYKYIIQKFKGERISAVWELGQQSEISVFAFDDKSVARATHLIKQSVPEYVHQLSRESSEVLHSQEWQSLVSQFSAANPGILCIAPSHDGLQIHITCIDNLMHGIVEEVQKFFAENSIYTQFVSFSSSRQKLVHMKWQGRLQTIANNLRAYKVQILFKEPGDKISIKGTEKGLQEVMKLLEQLNQEILCHEEVIHDPGKVKLLRSECDKDLKMIGRSNQCVLSLRSEDAQLQVMGSGGQVPAGNTQKGGANMDASASAQLPGGVTLSVVQGDITQMAVGAIVNAANTGMNHVGGLARDIVQKGGDIIQKDCLEQLRQRKTQLKEGDVMVSGSGRLPCQVVIHAVGPVYKGGFSGEQDCLYETIMTCLQTANESRLPSIAFPAISTGIFGYPAGEATAVIVEAVEKYFESHRRSTVKSVYLCHIGADIVGLFAKALQKRFPSAQGSAVHRRPTVGMKKDYTNFRSAPVATAQSMDVGRAHRIITVSVIPGEIAKQSADVIVNSTSNGLDLHNGAVSSSILKMAGQSLQAECKAKFPGGIQTGGVARTTGHGLNCQEIFHIALCNFSNPSAQQILSSAVTTCLSEASKQQYSSVAFPVLGTGNLGFPAPLVAQSMLDTIYQFEQGTPFTSLRDVRVVVYPADKANLQEFQLAQRGGGKRRGGHSGRKGGRHNRVFTTEEPGAQSASTRHVDRGGGSAVNAEFDIGGLRFVIKKGDITEEDTDAIVNSTNNQLDLSRGGVASALKKKCGPQLESECHAKVDEIQAEGVVMTKAYALKSRVILHVNADVYSDRWEEGIERCLKMAEQTRFRSIAMPALGTGIGLSPSLSALALFNTIVRMYKHGRSQGSLQEVRVVLFDSKMIPQFVDAVQQTGEKHNESRKKKGFIGFFKSAFTWGSTAEVKQTVSNPMMEEVSLFIYAVKQSDVDEALRNLDELAKEKFTRKEVQDDIICSFQEKDISRVYQIGAKHNAEMQVQKVTGRIICDGLHTQVYECMQEISKLIREVEQQRQQKETASMLANMISWCYLEVTPTGTEQKEYLPKENHIIETAYKEKKTHAEIKDQGGSIYIIDFNSMVEYLRSDPSDKVSVLRKDKIKDLAGGQVPESWEKHGPNETVKLVDLAATDPEYQKVASGFTASVGNVNITNIQRVQNPHLHHQYMAKKAHMTTQNPGIENEKTLWHGTSSDALININHHGFNRGFCGKNATVYGEGVYFAINATYSASSTYSPPDPSGNRYVYLSKVLVGHPTVGRQGLRVLPVRQGPILFDSATDNAKSPSMYVIFHDTQAYPEYLITFK